MSSHGLGGCVHSRCNFTCEAGAFPCIVNVWPSAISSQATCLNGECGWDSSCSGNHHLGCNSMTSSQAAGCSSASIGYGKSDDGPGFGCGHVTPAAPTACAPKSPCPGEPTSPDEAAGASTQSPGGECTTAVRKLKGGLSAALKATPGAKAGVRNSLTDQGAQNVGTTLLVDAERASGLISHGARAAAAQAHELAVAAAMEHLNRSVTGAERSPTNGHCSANKTIPLNALDAEHANRGDAALGSMSEAWDSLPFFSPSLVDRLWTGRASVDGSSSPRTRHPLRQFHLHHLQQQQQQPQSQPQQQQQPQSQPQQQQQPQQRQQRESGGRKHSQPGQRPSAPRRLSLQQVYPKNGSAPHPRAALDSGASTPAAAASSIEADPLLATRASSTGAARSRQQRHAPTPPTAAAAAAANTSTTGVAAAAAEDKSATAGGAPLGGSQIQQGASSMLTAAATAASAGGCAGRSSAQGELGAVRVPCMTLVAAAAAAASAPRALGAAAAGGGGPVAAKRGAGATSGAAGARRLPPKPPNCDAVAAAAAPAAPSIAIIPVAAPTSEDPSLRCSIVAPIVQAEATFARREAEMTAPATCCGEPTATAAASGAAAADQSTDCSSPPAGQDEGVPAAAAAAGGGGPLPEQRPPRVSTAAAVLAAMAMSAYGEPRGHVHNGPRMPLAATGSSPSSTTSFCNRRNQQQQQQAASVTGRPPPPRLSRLRPSDAGGKAAEGAAASTRAQSRRDDPWVDCPHEPDSPVSQASTEWEPRAGASLAASAAAWGASLGGRDGGGFSRGSFGGESELGPAGPDSRTQWWGRDLGGGRFHDADDTTLRRRQCDRSPARQMRGGGGDVAGQRPWWRLLLPGL